MCNILNTTSCSQKLGHLWPSSSHTKSDVIQANGRLYQVLTRLNENFVQVSKHGIINLNHLLSLEAGFTGNMIAKLNFDQRADVSRKYLPELERRLGL